MVPKSWVAPWCHCCTSFSNGIGANFSDGTTDANFSNGSGHSFSNGTVANFSNGTTDAPVFLMASVPIFLMAPLPIFLMAPLPIFLMSPVPIFQMAPPVPVFLMASVPIFLMAPLPIFLMAPPVPVFLMASVPIFLMAPLPIFLMAPVPIFQMAPPVPIFLMIPVQLLFKIGSGAYIPRAAMRGWGLVQCTSVQGQVLTVLAASDHSFGLLFGCNVNTHGVHFGCKICALWVRFWKLGASADCSIHNMEGRMKCIFGFSLVVCQAYLLWM